jgi:hypothetical protein
MNIVDISSLYSRASTLEIIENFLVGISEIKKIVSLTSKSSNNSFLP